MPKARDYSDINRRASLADLSSDLVDVEIHVDPVRDGLLMRVLHDEVLVEEAEGDLGRRGGEPDQVCIEVLQDLTPEIVDRAVAFVNDDNVEGLDGHGRGVFDFDRGGGRD